MTATETGQPDRPKNPYTVLACAVVLPGSGHVALGIPFRGLYFLAFMIIFGWVGNRLLPEASFLVRHGGALIVYGFSIIDAYRRARIRFEVWRYNHGPDAASRAS